MSICIRYLVNWFCLEGLGTLNSLPQRTQYRNNFFVYYDSGDGEQPFYLCLNGTRNGIRYGGIFLKFQIVEGVPHCLIVWRCKPNKGSQKVNFPII